ncbi:SDR family oxidoreductase [Sphingomonas sp. NCPPB 2930]|uniref:SDR family oxidoreductase n=1 Tax=Sphingomonas sp. NCPPB 2930 TaxID=3162788 RepID=UPI0036DD2C1C
MAILLTGSTGHTGMDVARMLASQAVSVRALTRSPDKARFPAGVTAVRGDLSDIEVMRGALDGVETLLLVAPNVPDELNQTLTTLALARDAGVRGIVYLSVFECDRHADVPHFACKVVAERMIERCDLPATILRSAYFMQNDLEQKAPLLDHGIYGMPLGHVGIAAVDTRDLAEIAARQLLRRHAAPTPLPRDGYNIVGPDDLTPETITQIWSEALGRAVTYAGDDLDMFQDRLKPFVPAGFAYDLALMLRAFQRHGARASAEDLSTMTTLLGRAPRRYAAFAAETAEAWKSAPTLARPD